MEFPVGENGNGKISNLIWGTLAGISKVVIIPSP